MMGEMADLALDEMMNLDELQQRVQTFDEAVDLGCEETLYDYSGARYPHVFRGRTMPKKVPVKKAPTKKAPVKKAVQPKRERRPEFLLAHGVPGVGKTTFGASAPNPVFVIDPQETGILDLQDFDLAPADIEVIEIEHSVSSPGWDRLLTCCDNLALRDDVQTVVFDSLTGFEKMCFQHVCNRDYDGEYSKDGFLSFYQGPKAAAKQDWPAFLDKLVDIRKLGKNVILIAHSKLQTVQNPTGPDYDAWKPYLDKETWSVTFRAMETVLFMNYDVEVTKERQSTKLKAKGGESRTMYTEYCPAYEAKNRSGLQPFITMKGDPWQNYYKAKYER